MKRKSTDLQREIYKAIKANPGITMHELERKIGTNPQSLVEHCENLAYLGVVRIEKKGNTRKLFCHP